MPENESPENGPLNNYSSAPTGPGRRRRYARSLSLTVSVSLTPTRVEILRHLAELRFLSLPQIARLCCPSGRRDLSEKSARRQMRALFDGGLVDVLPISRAALAPPGAPNDASLLYGSAPNVYMPTARGLDFLHRAGLAGPSGASRKKPAYGPRNSLFLAHELAVRDVRVWLELAARSGGHEVERWHDGEEAVITLGRERGPSVVRPDAWFVLRLGRAVLVGLVEVDRGTERGDRRWREKLGAYGTLFSSGHLNAVTGYVNARVLVLTPDARRRDRLCEMVGQAAEPLASRFWFASTSALDQPDLGDGQWRRYGVADVQPLVAPEALHGTPERVIGDHQTGPSSAGGTAEQETPERSPARER